MVQAVINVTLRSSHVLIGILCKQPIKPSHGAVVIIFGAKEYQLQSLTTFN